MTESSTQRGSASLAVNIASAVCFAAIGNGIIALLGWRTESTGQVAPDFAPPGLVIGSIWTALFAAMGAARWLAVRNGTWIGQRNGRLVTALIVACFVYPYYTLGFRSPLVGLAGGVITMSAAGLIAWCIAEQSRLAAVLVSATALWCAFACVILIRTLQLNA